MIFFWLMIVLMILIALGFVLKPVWRSHARLSLCLLLIVPTLSVSLYMFLGHSSLLAKWFYVKDHIAQVKHELQHAGSREAIIDKLKKHLRDKPGSARGWYLLGRLYASQQSFSDAVLAFKHAYKLKPDDDAIVQGYAEAIFYNNDEQLTAKARELLTHLLTKTPNHIGALSVLAFDAFNRNKYPEAREYWEKVLPQLPPNSPAEKAILKMIARAQS